MAVDVVSVAAAIVREHVGGPLGRIDMGDVDFATGADVPAQAAMSELRGLADPPDAIVGERPGRSGPHDAPRVWLVDPLCGTVNFAAGTALVAATPPSSSTVGRSPRRSPIRSVASGPGATAPRHGWIEARP